MFALDGPPQVKSVQGPGRGWLRTDLGGNNGHQYYLWWARAGAPPVRHMALSRDEVLIRAVRHHDETRYGLDPGDRDEFFPIEAPELHELKLAPEMLPVQQAAVESRARVRLVQGQPGTGKTTVLWRTASEGITGPLLYVTFSRRLAARAEGYFRQFAYPNADVRVLTFDDLLRELAGATKLPPVPPIDPTRGPLASIRSALTGHFQHHAPWEGDERLDDLHAELHAWFVGAALPEAFRGTPGTGTTGFDVAAYTSLRQGELGDKGARMAARIGNELRARSTLHEIAPGPVRARAVLDALRAGAPLPLWYRTVRGVLVDEVQDLTRVEAALLIELIARMPGDGDPPPSVMLAGDEGQTVRPTDFDWGVLSDQVSARLGPPMSFEMTGNVRSPRNLAAVVNRSAALYQHLPRAVRPRGRALAEIEEAVPGRIVRCRVRTDADYATVVGAFQKIPGAAFVYPGPRVPEAYRTEGFEVFTSDEAKGLDFAVVAVLDAGRRLVTLRERAQNASSERLDALHARTLADQLRVALSRATDTLVFLDRDDDLEGDSEIDQLCREEGEEFLDGCLREMPADELATLLDREDATAEELVGEFVQDVRNLLHDHPAAALERARRARGLLGRADSRTGVADQTLRDETVQLLGTAALHAALVPGTDPFRRKELLNEAGRAFGLAKQPEAARAAREVRDLLTNPAEASTDAIALLDGLDAVHAAVPEATRALRGALMTWCETLPDHPPPGGITAKVRLASAADAVAMRFAAEAPGLAHASARTRRRVAEALLAEEHPREALAEYRQMSERDLEGEAHCHESLGEYTQAAELYESSGDIPAALRCLRQVPDFDRALALAPTVDAEVTTALAWAVRARDTLRAGNAAATLTDAERRALWGLLEDVIGPRGQGGRRKPRAGG